MMYNDKIGYGPTVGDALTKLFGPGAAAAATGIEPTDTGARGKPRTRPQAPHRRPVHRARQGPRRRWRRYPPGPDATTTLSPAKAAALQDIQTAIGAARDAQKRGDFAAYGSALQRLDDAITKFNNTK